MKKFLTITCAAVSLAAITGCEAVNALAGTVTGLVNDATSQCGGDISCLLSQLQGLLGS